MRPLLPVMLLGFGLTACTPHAVTPPARTLALDSATAPAAGHTDGQVDLSRIGTVWGPELVGGNARLRHAVSSAVIVEGEAGLLHVLNEGDGGSRNGYTGRAGVMLRPPTDQELRVALTAGLGGGHAPAAGSWGSIDVGTALSGSHRWVRPLVGFDVAYARRFGDATFQVTSADGDVTTLQLPNNLILRGTAGVELGPDDRCVLLGISMLRFYLAESSVIASTESDPEADDDLFFAAGIGARFALD